MSVCTCKKTRNEPEAANLQSPIQYGPSDVLAHSQTEGHVIVTGTSK